jgi:phage shock protein PspC (stress-responsive transcriptional regulator)
MRSLSDRRIAGVCGGLSEYLEVDATLVRVIVAILAIYPGAIVGGVIVYAIAWLIIPQAQGTLQSVTTTA